MKFPRFLFACLFSLASFVAAAIPASASTLTFDHLRKAVSIGFLEPLAVAHAERAMVRTFDAADSTPDRQMRFANLLTATECGMTRSADGILHADHRRDRAAFGSVGLIV